MSRALAQLTSLAALVIVACGARGPLEASGDPDVDDGAEGSPANGGSGAAPGAGGGEPAPASGGSSTGPTQDVLPECVLGPTRESAEASTIECNWVASGRCYERRIEACACACPRDRLSRCISGSPGREVGVTCL